MWTKSHPLYGAQLRFERADGHLTEADGLIRAFAKSCEDYVVSNDHGQTIRLGGWPDIPMMLPVVVGDAIHNLRAALDYIVFELALLDSGKVQNGTQFPIEDVKFDPVNPKRGFDARRNTYLKGVNDRHAGMIERMQPYHGIDWTKTLADISNPDKHRKLTTLDNKDRGVTVTVHFNNGGRFTSPLPQTTSDGQLSRRYDLEIDASHAITIAPSDVSKPSLMSTLRRIETEVTSVVELFKPEFPV